MDGPAAAAGAAGIPPLSLSSGPAISGGGAFYGGTGQTGVFTYYGRKGPIEQITSNLPLLIGAGVVAWLIFNR